LRMKIPRDLNYIFLENPENCLNSNSDGLLAVLTYITKQGNLAYQTL
jgi:hypothetical protein